MGAGAFTHVDVGAVVSPTLRLADRLRPAFSYHVGRVMAIHISNAALRERVAVVAAIPQLRGQLDHPIHRTVREGANSVPGDDSVGVMGERERRHAASPALEID